MASEKLTLVTCAEWPIDWQLAAFGFGQGYLYSLTRPTSSPVASTGSSLCLEQALTSEPSEYGGKMPYTGQPRVQDQVAHCRSLTLDI